ncbi:ABC transporter ATP-binding protein [Allocatelliglobosispora scoriae]
MPDEPLLTVTGVSKRYGDHQVVSDVSFTLDAGRTLAVVGESGAGKTTVGAIVSGLLAATSGSVTVCGEDRTRVARAARHRRRRGTQLQLVPQDPYATLDPAQRVGDALDEAVRLAAPGSAADRRARVGELLHLVGLDADHARATPARLSGGQRQRVAIARALAPRPRLLVLDEPVSALDVSVQAQILNVLNRLQRDLGTAYLFITHDLAVVRQIADEVVVMRHGRVVESGTADQVLDDPRDDYTRRLIASTPRPGWRLDDHP